ncbi:putative F-box/kelch-repeat protein At3g17540 [Papaver somniferum]|uniref:putative F-box/kelch-repeat protein At3g17540 n=1 Tax=Papaver somniferum TaxID=3469 RepID=UPI000E704545|nr:putative F-box/kelch-repeat protein At3g17540 [Papaver somniferum]
MVNLPDEIMLDICVRSPVKTIGRFRCVNKTWYKLLNESKFVQMHLDHATEINRLSLMLHHSWNPKTFQDEVYTIDYDPLSPTCTSCVNKNLPFVANHNYSLSLGFLGHCNGLICMKPVDISNLFLWNPSTNEYIDLPEAPPRPPFTTEDFSEDYCIEGGFGYDYKTRNFNVSSEQVCVHWEGLFAYVVVYPNSGVEVWELKDDNRVKKSYWNKLFTIDLKKYFGLGPRTKTTRQQLGKLLNAHEPNIVFLSETKNTNDYVKNILNKSIFYNVACQALVGIAGGLVVAWDNSVKLTISYQDDNQINFHVWDEKTKSNWVLTCMYGVFIKTIGKPTFGKWSIIWARI